MNAAKDNFFRFLCSGGPVGKFKRIADKIRMLQDVIPLVGKILDDLLADGLTATMNRYNATDLRKQP